MDNKEMMMETVNTAAQEVAKKADCKGMICVGLGFVTGAALTIGAVQGAKKFKKIRAEKKAKKATPQVVMATAEVK